MVSWPISFWRRLSDVSFLPGAQSVSVSALLLGEKSAWGSTVQQCCGAVQQAEAQGQGRGYRAAKLQRSARRKTVKTKIQNGGRILTREIENHRTGDAKKTLKQEKRESDQINGLGKRSMQGCNRDGQGSRACVSGRTKEK